MLSVCLDDQFLNPGAVAELGFFLIGIAGFTRAFKKLCTRLLARTVVASRCVLSNLI